jgi:hypothetical protein
MWSQKYYKSLAVNKLLKRFENWPQTLKNTNHV